MPLTCAAPLATARRRAHHPARSCPHAATCRRATLPRRIFGTCGRPCRPSHASSRATPRTRATDSTSRSVAASGARRHGECGRLEGTFVLDLAPSWRFSCCAALLRPAATMLPRWGVQRAVGLFMRSDEPYCGLRLHQDARVLSETASGLGRSRPLFVPKLDGGVPGMARHKGPQSGDVAPEARKSVERTTTSAGYPGDDPAIVTCFAHFRSHSFLEFILLNITANGLRCRLA